MRAGVIRAALDGSGKAANTLLLLSADNGPGNVKCSLTGSQGPFLGAWAKDPKNGVRRVLEALAAIPAARVARMQRTIAAWAHVLHYGQAEDFPGGDGVDYDSDGSDDERRLLPLLGGAVSGAFFDLCEDYY